MIDRGIFFVIIFGLVFGNLLPVAELRAAELDLSGVDTNGNGYIDDVELLIVINYWAQHRPVSKHTPTPTLTSTPIPTPTPTPTSTPTPTPSLLPGATITVSISNLPAGAKPLEMVLIPAGTFLMGSTDTEKDRTSDEGPQHQVTLTKSFYMGKYEVTQAQWQAVLGNNPSSFSGKPNNPVEKVSWYDCVSFCNELSRMNGLTPVYNESSWTANWNANGYRLPTEAEWEYACRAGTSTRFYWGNDPIYAQIKDYA
jgi:formylglycine-generating enzyme required for sulfatase activity